MNRFLVVLALCLVGCSHAAPGDKFIDAQMKIINEHAAMLGKLGHMSKSYGLAFMVLGTYGWHGDDNGYFGAYSFSEAAYQQAKKAWFGHFKVLEGSNELWSEDDEEDDSCLHGDGCPIRFDNSAIGMAVSDMAMAWFEDGKLKYGGFSAKIIAIKDNGKIAILDKRAPHQAEQWGMQITPADWVDMCQCYAPAAAFPGPNTIAGDH